VKELRRQVDARDADAFYQLVYYPVVGASLLNKKFLYRDKSFLYGRQHRASASDYAQLAREAYAGIVAETNYYNQQLANGKWNGMMSMKPRNLPVYQEPLLPELKRTSPAPGTWRPRASLPKIHRLSGIKPWPCPLLTPGETSSILWTCS
jgi:hypothetical protein